MLLEILVVISYIAVGVLCFWAGTCYAEDKRKEKISARVVHPANIKVEPRVQITEYIVDSRNNQLDLDFPPVKKVG